MKIVRLTQSKRIFIFIFCLVIWLAIFSISRQIIVNAGPTIQCVSGNPCTNLPLSVQCDVAGYDASSEFTNNQCPTPGSYPYPDHCDSFPGFNYGLNPGYFPWLSNSGQPNIQTFTENYNGNSAISFDFNNLVYVCHTAIPRNVTFPTDGSPLFTYSYNGNNGLQLPSSETFYIDQYTATNLPPDIYGNPQGSSVGTVGINGGNSPYINVVSSTTSRYWAASAVGMNLVPNGNFTSDTTVYINIQETDVAYYGSQAYCVNGSKKNSSPGVIADTTYNGVTYPTTTYDCLPSWITQALPIEVNDSIESNVLSVNSDGSSAQQIEGVNFTGYRCLNNMSESPIDHKYYGSALQYSPYCLEIFGTPDGTGTSISGYDGPFDRPKNEGDPFPQDAYPTGATNGLQICGPFNSSNYQNHCSESTYECQVAGVYDTPDDCGGSPGNPYQYLDRGTDNGFNFVYVGLCSTSGSTPATSNPPPSCPTGQPPPVSSEAPTCSLAASPAQIEAGRSSTVTAIIYNHSSSTMYFTGIDPYTASFNDAGLGLSYSVPSSIGPGSYSKVIMNTLPNVPSGKYSPVLTIGWTDLQGNSFSKDCSATLTVVYKPFLRVYGGDVFAGTDSADIASCFDGGSTAGIF
ncbi:MAG: hypothetical protein ACYCPS_04570, partial [Candidatus Saccharimonadales bacterium]